MSTSANDNKVAPMISRGNISAMQEIKTNQGLGELSGDYFQLASILQTSLSVDEILAQFSKETASMIPHEGFSYVNEQHNIHFILGTHARFACTYQLTINEENLGLVTLTRASEFSEEESEKLERLLSTLHYPLRNALLYSHAINEAHKDALTGVGNRAALSQGLYREIEMANRHGRHLGLIIVDLDHFKRVNDNLGHLAGDKALQTIVHCLSSTIRVTDSLYRFGGEEFVILLPETDEAGVLRLAKRIRRRVEKLEMIYQDTKFCVTVSIGITNYHRDDDEKSIIKRADSALYRCKNEGRNCIRIADAPKMEFSPD